MTPAPRVLMLSERNIESRKWHAFQYEFEDVIAAVDRVELCAPPARRDTAATRFADRAVRRAGHPERVTVPAIRPQAIERDYDLFFAVFAFPSDIPHLLRLRHWRERCSRAICFIVEMFSSQVAHWRPQLELLRRFGFDRIFVLNPRPAAALSEIAECPVEFMGLGADMLRFSPAPRHPPRVIDFYQFGRRSQVTHAAALELARRDGLYYLYDTIFNVPLPDYRAHRILMAETMKRSRYFFAYRAAEDHPYAREDDALSARYFEAMAGGTVLLGSRPAAPEYDACFPWPDSTITIPYEAANLGELVAELERQPARLEAARRNNIVQSLLRHDWVHRWAQVLDAAGLPAVAETTARIEHLKALARATDEPEGLAA